MMRFGRKENHLSAAGDYRQWREAAIQQDVDNGMDHWKNTEQSKKYDHALIRSTLHKIRHARLKKNHQDLLFYLNEGVHGNFGSIGNEELYAKALFGTKKLIEEFLEELNTALVYMASEEVTEFGEDVKRDLLSRASECFGHSALMLSGSGPLLYFHIGVVLELLEQDLLPDVVSGASGGAFIGSVLCAHERSRLDEVFDLDYFVDQRLRARNRELAGMGTLERLRARIATPEDLQRAIDRLIPDVTFQQAFELTGMNLNVSVASAESAHVSRLLNAKTSPNVYLREAVRASSAAPGLFAPVSLAARNDMGLRQAYMPEKRWVDGSLSSDLPMKRLARLYGVNHFIVSQTNPHVIPFVTDTKRRKDTLSLMRYACLDVARVSLNTTVALWQRPPFDRGRAARIGNRLLSIVNQDYKGDINILPPREYLNPVKQFAPMSFDDIKSLVQAGRRSTWPKIEMIRQQTRIGRTLRRLLAGPLREQAKSFERASA